MGWIKRHWFWYTHNKLHIEPTEEQKAIMKLPRRYNSKQFAMVIAATMALSEGIK